MIVNNKNFQEIMSTIEEREFSAAFENLGRGEAECISICRNRKYVFATNDFRAIREADRQNIAFINLEMILKSIKELGILNKIEVENLINEIEEKDRVKIANREYILS